MRDPVRADDGPVRADDGPVRASRAHVLHALARALTCADIFTQDPTHVCVCVRACRASTSRLTRLTSGNSLIGAYTPLRRSLDHTYSGAVCDLRARGRRVVVALSDAATSTRF